MRFRFGAAALAAFVLLTMPVAAQDTYGRSQGSQTVTQADIQRLQDQVYDISSDLARARTTNTDQFYRLQSDLDDARDEVVYLRVKLRKEGRVYYNEYAEVRDHIQRLRSAIPGDYSNRGNSTWNTNSGNEGTYGGARTNAPGSNPPYPSGSYPSGTYGGTNDQQAPRSTRRGEVPAGQELDVRLDQELNSETAQVEDRFTATTVVDLYQGNEVLIPAGSRLRGVVSSVNKATRTNRKGSMTVAFDQITIRGRTYPIRATVTQAIESEGIKGEIGKIGAGSAVGAIIGGIIGGAKGALLGVLIGGGGMIAATEGKDVALPPGTILRVRLDEPLIVR